MKYAGVTAALFAALALCTQACAPSKQSGNGGGPEPASSQFNKNQANQSQANKNQADSTATAVPTGPATSDDDAGSASGTPPASSVDTNEGGSGSNDLLVNPAEAAGQCYKADATTCSTEKAIFDLTNAEREKRGLAPFAYSSHASYVAREFAKVLAPSGRISHAGFPHDRISAFSKEFGTRFLPAAENVALQPHGDPAGIVAAWMKSAGHRANIYGKARTLGVGLVQGRNGAWYAVQLFGFN